MEKPDQKRIIEAALFMAARPLSIENLSEICSSGNLGLIRKDIEELEKEYKERNSAIEIYRDEKGGYGMKVVQEIESKVSSLAPLPEISPAILKTLALIAYEQPITQARIVKERGNRVYRYIKILLKEEFISAEKHGRTKMLRTTPKFKDYFQIKDLKELKSIKVKLDKFKSEKGKINV
jgi:segregation and condensation protein B